MGWLSTMPCSRAYHRASRYHSPAAGAGRKADSSRLKAV